MANAGVAVTKIIAVIVTHQIRAGDAVTEIIPVIVTQICLQIGARSFRILVISFLTVLEDDK